MKDLFEGTIDLNELANSEESILDLESVETKEDLADVADTDAADVKDTTKVDIDNTDDGKLDLDYIANLGEEEEDADQDKEKIVKTPADKKEHSPSSESDTLTSLASALKEAGVFSSLEDDDLGEITSAEDLIKAVEKQIKHNEFAALTEEQKEYLEALKEGVPTETFAKSKSNVAQYEALEDKAIEENINLQYGLIVRKFMVDGMDQAKAEKYARIAVREENAAEEAKNAREELIKYEQSVLQDEIDAKRKEKEDLIAKESESLSVLKSKINEAAEILPGIRVNSATKEKIFNSIISPTKLDDKGNPLNEVMESYNDNDYRMRLHSLHVLTKGFTDFSKFEKTTKTKAIKEFEEKLNTGNVVRTGSSAVRGATTNSLIDGLGDYVPPHLRK